MPSYEGIITELLIGMMTKFCHDLLPEDKIIFRGTAVKHFIFKCVFSSGFKNRSTHVWCNYPYAPEIILMNAADSFKLDELCASKGQASALKDYSVYQPHLCY